MKIEKVYEINRGACFQAVRDDGMWIATFTTREDAELFVEAKKRQKNASVCLPGGYAGRNEEEYDRHVAELDAKEAACAEAMAAPVVTNMGVMHLEDKPRWQDEIKKIAEETGRVAIEGKPQEIGPIFMSAFMSFWDDWEFGNIDALCKPDEYAVYNAATKKWETKASSAPSEKAE